MANCIIGFPNHVDAAAAFTTVAFSNGSWSSTLPLTNLRNPLLSNVARSTNDDLTSTKLDVDLGLARDVQVIAIPKHNISRNGYIRVRGSNDVAFSTTVLDTGWVDAWPIVKPFGSLYWGAPGLWDGKLSPEEAANISIPFVYVHESMVVARYWRIEINDTSNPDGYIDITRLFICPGWQPARNMSYGVELGIVDPSEVQISDGGAKYFRKKTKFRTARFKIDNITVDEALTRAFDMMRTQGITQQVFFIFDPEDTFHLHRRSFLANMRQLSSLEYPFYNLNSIAFDIEEVIA